MYYLLMVMVNNVMFSYKMMIVNVYALVMNFKNSLKIKFNMSTTSGRMIINQSQK